MAPLRSSRRSRSSRGSSRQSRHGNVGGREPWDLAAERLQALPHPPTANDVYHALEPIGLSTTLVDHEASRVLALLDVRTGKSAALAAARLSGAGPRHYDAVRLVAAVQDRRSQQRAAGRSNATRNRALTGLSDTERSELEYARLREKDAIEVARAHESLAKKGLMPTWASRSKRVEARNRTAARKAIEDRLARRHGALSS